MVSGPVLLKIKGKRWISYFGDQNNENKLNINNEIGQMLVSGALDDTKKMRKAGADMFAKSGPGKTQQIGKYLNMLRVFLVCPVDLAKNL